MEIKLKERMIPRSANGDAKFTRLGGLMKQHETPTEDTTPGVLDVFGIGEVVELVNRALYQLEYQREAHRKRGHEQRAKEKALREALKKQGVDPKKTKVDNELKGE